MEEGMSKFNTRGPSMAVTLQLAFQSVGIVYGDIGTSPLYVLPACYINDEEDILGVLSLIYYTITLLPLVKYVFIVLRATDNGDGGTFALYSLICRYAKVGMIPTEQAEDANVSNYQLELPDSRRCARRALKIKSCFENSPFAKFFLLFITMLGTCMVIGDGILTPCISVLSAVGGIKEATTSITDENVVWISIGILISLFMVQRFGTGKVGYTFAPILTLWFICIGTVGIYNFFKYDPAVIKALNPYCIVKYFKRNKKNAWISLGGVVMCITGAEALFADVGHFTVRAVQISTCSLVYPALMLAYSGQASYLHKHVEDYTDAFYKSIPGPVYWPMFVIAVMAAVIASQALISATFSIIQQSLSLGCFPRVKIVHTSSKFEGQVYIPEVNYILMILCVAVTAGFKTTTTIGNAYGIAVVSVMTITSALLVLIMLMIWKTNIFLVMAYVAVIGSVELVYLSAVLYKFPEGGYLPLAFSVVLMFIMYVWHDVYRRKYHYQLENKISPERVEELVADSAFCRIPGLAMFYSELVQGIPPIFRHYVANVAALHSVLVFVCIKSLPISKVPMEERFLFSRAGPRELNVFRCVARYGYTDVRNEKEPFENVLVEKLKEFIADEKLMMSEERGGEILNGEDEVENMIETIERAQREGVVHLIGEIEVTARKGSNIGKRIKIDYAYTFLIKNLRQPEKVFDIPHGRMVKVGMTYDL